MVKGIIVNLMDRSVEKVDTIEGPTVESLGLVGTGFRFKTEEDRDNRIKYLLGLGYHEITEG